PSRICSACYRRTPPVFAAVGHECYSLAGGAESFLIDRLRFSRRQMVGQPDQAEIPADANRARAELLPVIVHRTDVRQLQAGPLFSFCGDTQLHPAHAAPEFPGQGEIMRRLALGDDAARIVLDLIPAPEP